MTFAELYTVYKANRYKAPESAGTAPVDHRADRILRDPRPHPDGFEADDITGRCLSVPGAGYGAASFPRKDILQLMGEGVGFWPREGGRGDRDLTK
jgi:hypothetical protein